ncbi:MAG: tetratricopeptide repeat protein [Gemmatimonadota bacterium]|nr:MAG: tetratricopeptide repeat protein [Gemmatimonadota bacterium]
MSFTFNPESRLQERTGRLAVAVLLGLAIFGLGCDIPIGDRSEPAVQETPRREAVQPASWVAPPVEQPEPPEPADVPQFDPAAVTYQEAEAAYFERRYVDAVDMFTAYIEREGDNAWGQYMLGLSALKAGFLERSEAAFNRALELDPNHVKSMHNLSRVLLETERTAEALAQLEVALDIDPASDAGYRLRGIAYLDLGRDDDAIDSFREAISVNAEDSWSMNNLGLALIRQGLFEEALYPLARATELRSDVAVFHNNLGVALERTGHFTAAAEAYAAALEQDDGYEKASVSLARVTRLEEDPTTVPVNLTALARQFVTEMEGWYPPVAKVPPLDEEPTGVELPQAPLEELLQPVDDTPQQDSGVASRQDTTAVRRDSTKVKPDTTGRGGREG